MLSFLLLLLWFISPSLQIGLPVAPGKEQSSVTVAIIGLYSELIYNSPSDYSQYDPFNTPSWQLYDDLAIEQAAQMINANSSILPNTTVKIKHFNFYDPRYASNIYAIQSFGYAGLVALNISQNPDNSDIVAVIGGWGGKPVRIEAGIYSHYDIPYCGIIPSDSALDNKYNYPNFFRTRWSQFGYELHVLKFLQTHNVTRIGIVTSGGTISQTLQDTFTAKGIEVTVFVIMKVINDIPSVLALLKKTDVRYIYVDFASGELTSYLYFTAYDYELIGPKYVWMSQDYPYFDGQEKVFPNRTLDNDVAGFLFIYGAPLLNWDGTDYPPTYNQLNESIYSNWPVVDGMRVENLNLTIPTDQLPFYPPQQYMEGAYDCIMMLAAGFDKLLRDDQTTSAEQLSKRKLQKKLNLKLWQKSGYQGIGNIPLSMNDVGSADSTFYWITITQGYNFPIAAISYPNLSITDYPDATVFNGNGTSWPSDGSVKITLVSLIENTSLRAFLTYSMEAGGIFLCVVCFVVQVVVSKRKRKDAAIYSTGMIVSGATISYLSLSYYVGTPTIKDCVLRVWLPLSGLPLSLLTIIINNARLYYIFNSRTNISKWKLSNSVPLTVTFTLVFVFQCILVVWAFQNKPDTHVVLLSQGIKSVVCVDSLHNFNALTAFITLGSLLILALFTLAYNMRNISQEYNESIQMLFIAISCVCTSGIFLPTILTETPSTRQVFSEVLLIGITTTIIIFIYLVPKLALKIAEAAGIKQILRLAARISGRMSQSKSAATSRSQGRSPNVSVIRSVSVTPQIRSSNQASRGFTFTPILLKGVPSYQTCSFISRSIWKEAGIGICKQGYKPIGLIFTSRTMFHIIPLKAIIDLNKNLSDGYNLYISYRLFAKSKSKANEIQQVVVEFGSQDDLEHAFETIVDDGNKRDSGQVTIRRDSHLPSNKE